VRRDGGAIAALRDRGAIAALHDGVVAQPCVTIGPTGAGGLPASTGVNPAITPDLPERPRVEPRKSRLSLRALAQRVVIAD
jgi:hypothetical protein